MAGTECDEKVKVIVGKTSQDASRSFDRFLKAFRGDVVHALNFLILRNNPVKEIQSSGVKKDLVVDIQKKCVSIVNDMIDYFISKRKLLSRGDAIEILIHECGIEWNCDSSVKITSSHMPSTIAKLDEDRSLKQFCDLKIVVSNCVGDIKEVYYAHKCILAVISSLFASKLQHKTQLITILSIPDPKNIGLIFDFVYRGTIDLNEKNSSEIYHLAEYFGIEQLLNTCKDYFKLSHVRLVDTELNVVVTEESDTSLSEFEGAPILEGNVGKTISLEIEGDSLMETTASVESTISDTLPVAKPLKRKKKSSNESVHVCDICKAFFSLKSHLNRHMLSHNGERKHCCTTCGKLFLKSDHLLRHERTHSADRPFDCEKCGRKFKTKDNLKRHSLAHTEDRPFFCEICAKQFKDKPGLLVHQKSHAKTELVCQHCGKIFTQRNRFVNHMFTHTNPPACKTCGKKFKHRTQLVRHEMTHTGNRPFSCESCGKQFIDMHSLKLHQKRHTGLGMHECSQCDRKFIDRYHLTRHMKMHTGEKPHKCSHCGKSFSRADNCEIHKVSCGLKAATKETISSVDQSKKMSKAKRLTKPRRRMATKTNEGHATTSTHDKQIHFLQNVSSVITAGELNCGYYTKIAKKPPRVESSPADG